MDPDEGRCADLQRQIVELRLRLEHSNEAQSALVAHYVTREVAQVLRGRLLDEGGVEWVETKRAEEKARKKDFRDIMLHSLKFGAWGTLAFIAYSVWEAVKAKVGAKP